MPIPLLSLADTRVLGVLVEKQHTVPDTYPLSLNALVVGCNQKTSREPVLDLREAEVQASVDGLRHAALVVESIMLYRMAARRLGHHVFLMQSGKK